MKRSTADDFIKQAAEGDETHPERGPSGALQQKCRLCRSSSLRPPAFPLQRLFAAAGTDAEPGSTSWSPAASCHVSLWTTQPNVTQCVLLCKLRSTPPATQLTQGLHTAPGSTCSCGPMVCRAVHTMLQSVWSDCCRQLSRSASLENPEPLPISCRRVDDSNRSGVVSKKIEEEETTWQLGPLLNKTNKEIIILLTYYQLQARLINIDVNL